MAESEAERLAAKEAYDEFFDAAMSEPIKYLKHDTNSHEDDKLYRLVSMHGMSYYGMYWVLSENVAKRKGHYYDVSDEVGWKKLARDMSCLCDVTVDQCKRFVGALYDLGLIIPEQYDELHRVAIMRIMRDAYKYAESVAGRKLGAWKTNRKKLGIA
jgi:hypothetical protein